MNLTTFPFVGAVRRLAFLAGWIAIPFTAWCSTSALDRALVEASAIPPALKVPIRHIVLESAAVNYTLLLDVTVPPDYESNPSRRYPVVYLTDGYWRREAYGVIHALGREGRPQPCIVVGVGYPEGNDYGKLRVRDLVVNPVSLLLSFGREIIPAIEKEYRTDPTQRILWGNSNGGFFTLFCLSVRDLTGPLFQRNIAVSPTLDPRSVHEPYPDLKASLVAL